MVKLLDGMVISLRKAKMWTCIIGICVLAFISATWLFGGVKPYYESNQMIKAIRNDDIEKLEDLLQSGADPNAPNGFYKGIWKYINSFCETAPDFPLSVACSRGNLQMVHLLLDYGADPILTEQDEFGWSALSCAIMASENEDCIEIVELLIANGANIDSKEDYYRPVVLASMQSPAEGYPGPEGEQEHAERIVELVMLLMGDMDVNCQEESYTLLMNAALRGNLSLTEYLLSIGADPRIQSDDGRTAYDFAIMWEHHDVAEVLSQWRDENAEE